MLGEEVVGVDGGELEKFLDCHAEIAGDDLCHLVDAGIRVVVGFDEQVVEWRGVEGAWIEP